MRWVCWDRQVVINMSMSTSEIRLWSCVWSLVISMENGRPFPRENTVEANLIPAINVSLLATHPYTPYWLSDKTSLCLLLTSFPILVIKPRCLGGTFEIITLYCTDLFCNDIKLPRFSLYPWRSHVHRGRAESGAWGLLCTQPPHPQRHSGEQFLKTLPTFLFRKVAS